MAETKIITSSPFQAQATREADYFDANERRATLICRTRGWLQHVAELKEMRLQRTLDEQWRTTLIQSHHAILNEVDALSECFKRGTSGQTFVDGRGRGSRGRRDKRAWTQSTNISIISMLSVTNVWLRPPNQRKEADAAKALLSVPDSDHLTLLNVYNSYVQNGRNKGWASDNYLNARALSQADNVRSHLLCIMERNDLDLLSINDERRSHDSIKQTLLCGLFTQVAHNQGGSYVTAKDEQIVALHPSCSLGSEPEWVMFNEFILTTRQYIRTVTEIRVSWLLEFSYNYFDPTTFKDGEMKRALQKANERRGGKASDATSSGSNGGNRRAKKRQRKTEV